LDLDFLDLDTQIELDLNESITNIIAQRGEEFFRSVETAALKNAILSLPLSNSPKNKERIGSSPLLEDVGQRQGQVIALGGGALLRAENRQLVEENGTIVFLETSVETLVKRLAQDENKRPLLAGNLRENLETLTS